MDPGLLQELTARAKLLIRKRMRALRLAHPLTALALRSQRIVDHVSQLPAFHRAHSVGLYAPLLERHEVDIGQLDELARSQNKALFYPFMDPTPRGFVTGFRKVMERSELRPRGQGFLEPDPSKPPAERGELDLIIVPALAVASLGHRIGYGSGFYDATLPDFCPPAESVVVAFEFQLLSEIPCLETDVACHYVVTDQRTLASSVKS